MLPRILWASAPSQLEMHCPIIRCRISFIQIGRTPGHLSNGISLLLLYASNEVQCNTSAAILLANFANVSRSLIETLPNEVRNLLQRQESQPEGPCDPFGF